MSTADDLSDNNVAAVLLALQRALAGMREQHLAMETLLQFFDKNPAPKRANMYVLKTIDTNVSVPFGGAKKLFDAQADGFGNFPANNLYILSIGGGAAVVNFYVNGSSDVNPLKLSDILQATPTGVMPFSSFDVYTLSYEVTTTAVGTAKLLFTGWIK